MESNSPKQPVAKPTLAKRILRAGILLFGLLLVLLLLAAALAIWRPTDVGIYLVNHLEPRSRFTADSIRWTSSHSLQIENARFGHVLKAPRIRLQWEWKKLRSRRLKELKLERAEIFLDLKQLPGSGKGPDSPVKTAATGGRPWYLDRLLVERGGLMMVGLGESVPPLALEIEGSFEDVPFGGELAETDLQKKRAIELRNIHIHSPLDLAVTVLKMEKAVLEFRYGGLRSRELDSLVFRRPILEVDRGFFWFVEELRKAHASRPAPQPSTGPEWKVRSFRIEEGRLDITRLREISVQYPFEFEVHRENMNLRDLSLANFQIDLNIPNQNMTWEAMGMPFENLRGKISFNLSESRDRADTGPDPKGANNVVNTLYVDRVRWNRMELADAWLSMTFTPHGIDSAFGGAFASGYINGGVSCGWSGQDPWRVWGSAAEVDAGRISTALGYEVFTMNGHAEMNFDVEGKGADLRGALKAKSLSHGTIQIRSLDHVLDRIRRNTRGVKREMMHAFVESLRDYPYQNYAMEIHYTKPDAVLNFRSEGEPGSRRLDLKWHGRDNGKSRTKNSE